MENCITRQSIDHTLSDIEIHQYQELAEKHSIANSGPIVKMLRDRQENAINQHKKWLSNMKEQTPRIFGVSFEEWCNKPWPERRDKAEEAKVFWGCEGWTRYYSNEGFELA